MSIAAASFHNNSWDLPIRRAGLSFLMSGEGPQHFFHPQQQQGQTGQEEQGQKAQGNDPSGSAHSDRLGPVLPMDCHVVDLPRPSPILKHDASSAHGCWGHASAQQQQLGGQGRQRSVHVNLADLGAVQHEEPQDNSIIQKFSALSVHFGSSRAAGSIGKDGGSGARPPSDPQNQVPAAPASHAAGLADLTSVGASGGGSASSFGRSSDLVARRKEACLARLVGIESAPGQNATPSGVFSSLDAVDEHSPPFSPAGAPVPSLLSSTRASSFPPYHSRSASGSATASFCCCLGAGICSSCRGDPFPVSIRASASHPAPTRQHSLSEGLHPAVHVGRIQPVHAQDHPRPAHGDDHGAGFDSWFVHGVSPNGTEGSAPRGGIPATSQGWGLLETEQGTHSWRQESEQTRQQGVGQGSLDPAADQGVPFSSNYHAGAPGGRQHDLDGGPPSPWGFGAQSMDSSSLSLSQGCSDSLGGGEVNSAMGGDVPSSTDTGAGGPQDQEVESVFSPTVAGCPTGSGLGQGLWFSPQATALLSPGAPSVPGFCHTPSPAPLAGPSSGSPLVPRSSSSPMPRHVRPRDAGSPLSSPGFRRGLSSFFGGKSRSFTSLAEVGSIQSIQELAKPVRNYNRRKRIGSGREGGSPRGKEGACSRMPLGVGKEPRGSLFKKGGGGRQSLGVQAGLAVAFAMGSLEGASQTRPLEDRTAGTGMETVMEESADTLRCEQEDETKTDL